MNELQKTELALLRSFLDICEKLELRYYLVCGSALGAVKYGGFIPWDDDLDVAMPRADYRRFLEEAPALLPEELFLQNFRTDPAFPQIYTKLRHSGTTYIEQSSGHLPIHHGVYMDIFPLDGYPSRRGRQRMLELGKRIYLHLLATAFAEPTLLRQKLEWRLKRALGLHRHTARFAAAYERMICAWPAEEAAVWCNHGNWQGKLDYAPAEYFGPGKEAAFEGLPVRVPERAEEYLRRKYGDYTKDPPEEEQVGHHYYTVLDCTRPYGTYLKQGHN